mgnify:CR=1 FL=1
MREHPIPPVTERLQYRAIGIVRGVYKPENPDQLTRGHVLDADGNALEAVVLGRVMTLMRRHIEMSRPHLWVVYPRCRSADQLHLQIAGIWEPSTLLRLDSEQVDVTSSADSGEGALDTLPEGDDYFSIRGELIFTRPETNDFVIKVRQKPKQNGSNPPPFKLQLKGNIPLEHIRYFVSTEIRRQGQALHLENYEVISQVTSRRGKRRK